MSLPSRWKKRDKLKFHSRTSHSRGSHPQESYHGNSNPGNSSGENHQGSSYCHYDRRHCKHSHNRSNSSERGYFKQKKDKFKPQKRHHQSSHNSDGTSTNYYQGKHRKRPAKADDSLVEQFNNESASTGPISQGLAGSSEDQSGASTAGNNQSQVTQIPGFYYDPEKKKYFRLLPGHNNYNPLTKDGIQLKAAEEKRIQMIQGNLADQKSQSKHGIVKTKTTGATPLMHLHRDRQQGHLTTQQFARYAHEQCISLLPVKATCELKPFPDSYFNGEEGCISFLKMDQQQGRILMAIQDAYMSRIWQGTVTCDDKKHGQLAISNWGNVNVLDTKGSKITNVEFAKSDMNGSMQVLYSVSGGATSYAQIYRCYYYESASNPGWRKEFVFSCETMHEMIWTCAWNHNTQMSPQFSLGASRKAVIFYVENANRFELFSGHSDVLAQVYSSHRPILYNGTRRGEILGCDLRTDCYLRSDLASQFKHSFCICSLKLLKDENYLLGSDISGEVKLWDIRACRCVQTYEGFVNNHSQLPICIDSSETIIYGAGIDKCTKFWSLQDGRLLHSIPSPLPVRKQGIPTPAYSRQWYGGATPGLILGMERQLFWYSLSSW